MRVPARAQVSGSLPWVYQLRRRVTVVWAATDPSIACCHGAEDRLNAGWSIVGRTASIASSERDARFRARMYLWMTLRGRAHQ